MSEPLTEPGWPPIDYEDFTWESRYSTQLDADLAPTFRYQAAVPPFIALRDVALDARTAAIANRAEQELVRFDARAGDELLGFAPLLLRSEAAASSQIENLTASARAILTAELGDTTKRNATEIVGNTRAMTSALELANTLQPDAVRAMHLALMDGTNHTPGR